MRLARYNVKAMRTRCTFLFPLLVAGCAAPLPPRPLAEYTADHAGSRQNLPGDYIAYLRASRFTHGEIDHLPPYAILLHGDPETLLPAAGVDPATWTTLELGTTDPSRLYVVRPPGGTAFVVDRGSPGAGGAATQAAELAALGCRAIVHVGTSGLLGPGGDDSHVIVSRAAHVDGAAVLLGAGSLAVPDLPLTRRLGERLGPASDPRVGYTIPIYYFQPERLIVDLIDGDRFAGDRRPTYLEMEEASVFATAALMHVSAASLTVAADRYTVDAGRLTHTFLDDAHVSASLAKAVRAAVATFGDLDGPAGPNRVVVAPPPPATLDAVVPLVPSAYRHRLVQQLSLAEGNGPTWLDAIARCPADQREGLAYLLVNMSAADLKSLHGDFLLRDVALAYRARAATPWGAAVPKELFLRDVLPYASLDEQRDDWRQDYHDRFAPLVKDCKSAADAAQLLNRTIFKTTGVTYHATKRQKPNQSPAESARIGYASCSGLSIMLVDACRAVGVPARVAGTPLWADKSGNHTWAEVWDRQWYFVGADEPGPLDRTWFAGNAALADPAKAENRIYAADVNRDAAVFPLVWAPGQQDVHADDVTRFYTGRRKLTVTGGPAVEVRQDGQLVAASPTTPAAFDLAAGTTYAVTAAGVTKDVVLPAAADVTVAVP